MPDITALSPKQQAAFSRLIAKYTGMEIRERDQANLTQKILERIQATKRPSATTYYQLLESLTPESHQEWLSLVALLTNSESYFFRDQEQFALLKSHILPHLIQKNQQSKTLRICSAGCSSGEEPYSTAILLSEIIPDLEQWDLMIIGVDINQAVIQKATSGHYSAWSFRGVNPDIKARYFQEAGEDYRIDSKIQKMVRFETVNLFKDPFPCDSSELRNLDLILCRNVFIYFKVEAIATVLEKFYQALRPSGYLLTGHAELAHQNLDQFHIKVFEESLVYQRPDPSCSGPKIQNLKTLSTPPELISYTDLK